MNLEGRIFQSLRPRRDGVLLRSDVAGFGSASQVSFALRALLARGQLVRLARGVYAKPDAVKALGVVALLSHARLRMKVPHRRANPIASYVRKLAKREGVTFTPTFADLWAAAVTKLAGDEVGSDMTDDLLVALARAGKLSPRDMTKLVVAHHRSLAHV